METSAHIKYLLANEQDNRWGVVVTTTGYQIIEPQTSYPPSNHPCLLYTSPSPRDCS